MFLDIDEVFKTHQKWLPAWNRTIKQPSPAFIALLVDLQDFHTQCFSDNKYKKSLSNTNKKSLNGMQQKMRRNNGPFENAMQEFREVNKKKSLYNKNIKILIQNNRGKRR